MAWRGWHWLTCSCLFCLVQVPLDYTKWFQYDSFEKEVHGMVPEPQNVRIHSLMFDSILQWDPPNFHEGNVTYTVQYKQLNKFIDLCKRIDFTKCNITSIPIYGSTNVRVRTEFEAKPSYWINITFTPYTDTNIGPPAVQIGTTKPGVLNVQLTDPFFIRDGSKSSLRDLYGSVLYRLLIWKKDSGEQIRNESINHTFQRISGLDPGTKYCLKAQAFIEGLDKSGEWSEDVCIRTASSTNTGINPVQLTVLLLSVLISLAFCCFIIFRVYRCTKYAFFPSYSLPQHFKEFLSKPSYSSQFLSSNSQGEDHAYDKIIVLSEELRDGNNGSEEQLSNTKDQFQKSQKNASRPKVVPDCMLLEYP